MAYSLLLTNTYYKYYFYPYLSQNLTLPNNILKSSDVSAYSSMLFSNARRGLEYSIINKYIENRDYLLSKGLYPLNPDGEPLQLSQLTTLVSNAFHNLRKMELYREEGIQETEEFQIVMQFLHRANLVVPIVAGDWEVDRTGEAVKSLGLKSYEALEQTLAERYPLADQEDKYYRHLEKGVGNGEALYLRRKANEKLSKEKHFEQFGIADKLYFPIEKLLKRFLKPEHQKPEKQKFVECLGYALRQELKGRWFDVEGSIIRKWKPKGGEQEVFDLNVIFELLKNPRPWLEKWYSPLTGTFKFSHEFEHDQLEKLPIEQHHDLLKFSGYDAAECQKIINERKIKDIAELQRHIDSKSHVLRTIIRELGESNPDEINKNLNKWLGKIKLGLEPDRDISFIPGDFEGLILYLDETIQIYQSVLRDTRIEKQNILRNAAKPVRSKSSNLLKDIFQPEFAEAVETEGSKAIDLNNHAPVDLKNIVIDFFDKIPKHFGKESFFLISGVRSDSHENDADFQKDIEQNLALLKPGGCIVTDGLRASYSRVYRFEEVAAAINKNPDFRAEVIVDTNSGEPKSLFIQRAHPTGFLSVSEKSRFLSDNMECRDMNAVSRRPDLRALNVTRRRILAASNNNVHYFSKLHRQIGTRVAKLLSWEAVRGTPAEAGFSSDVYDDIYKKIIDGELPVSDRAVESVTDRIGSEINSLVRDAHIVTDHETHLEKPDKNTIYTFPVKRTDPVDPQLNRCYRFSSDELASNKEFSALDFQIFIDQREWELRDRVKKLKVRGMRNPITLISFEECATNKLLVKKLDDLNGEIVRHISIRFSANGKGGFSSIEEKEAKLKEIDELINAGGVVVCGGSLHDSFTETFYRDAIAGKLLDAILKPESKLRLMNICFSAQVMADLIGKRYFNGQLKTQPGMLEVGPTPINVLRSGRRHPWLENFPGKVTMATTHTGHIINTFPAKKHGAADIDFTPLMESNITGLPLAWAACQDRILSTLAHPEIDLVTRNGELSNDFDEIQTQLEQAGLPHPELMRRNWHQTMSESGKSNLTTNAGNAMLISGLWHLLHDIPNF